MYCSRCGAQVNDNSNFCCHCGSKLNSKSEIYNNQEMDEEDITNKLTYIVTFLSDICISHFNMSKKEYTSKRGVQDFCFFLRTVLECTDKHCNSTTKVTRKVIEEYASNVDCILTELFQKHPEIRYSKQIQKLSKGMGQDILDIRLSDTGHIIESTYKMEGDNVSDEMIEEEISLYSCFQTEFFEGLDKFREQYGTILDKGNAQVIKEKTDGLFVCRGVIWKYLHLLEAVRDVLFEWLLVRNDIKKELTELLTLYPADHAMDFDRTVFEKKYKHFEMDCRDQLTLEEKEMTLEFEMWDAEDVSEIGCTVAGNDYYDIETGRSFPNLFQFEIKTFEETDEWSEKREGFIKKVQVKAISNYTADMIGVDDLGCITFQFSTNIKSKSSELNIHVRNFNIMWNNLTDFFQELKDEISGKQVN